MSSPTAIVIGSGFAGLSAASFLAKAGWKVTVLEKNGSPGGRARQLKDQGFQFDMGPSFYWMPDVFEHYFQQFGRQPSDYYDLLRLDPSYRIYWNEGSTDIPANYQALEALFESIEAGAALHLRKYLKEAAHKYDTGINRLVYKPSLSITEFLDWQTIKGVMKMDVFSSIKKHIRKYFKDPRLCQILEFPILFLGALPENTPALYSLMNYADMKLGTWYPQGGMYSVVNGMFELAKELGVQFHFEEPAVRLEIQKRKVSKVITNKSGYVADMVVSGADYHFTEKQLLPEEYRTYSAGYWKNRVMSPSCILFFLGLNKKISNACHHSLFFDTSFDIHGKEIYENPQWPSKPLFYVSTPSVSDPGLAPAGCENLVLLIPVAPGLDGDTEALREKYFQEMIGRIERHLGQQISDSIIYKKSYSISNFVDDYNSFRGNAYGLANTLGQTAILRPSCRSKKVKNLFYTGQLTVPGPGVPPSLISGEVVAKQVIKAFR